MTGAARPAASLVTGSDDDDQMPRLQAYLARHPGTGFGPAEGEVPGVQVTMGGGSRLIIHHSLKALLDKLEKHEQAAVGGGEPS